MSEGELDVIPGPAGTPPRAPLPGGWRMFFRRKPPLPRFVYLLAFSAGYAYLSIMISQIGWNFYFAYNLDWIDWNAVPESDVDGLRAYRHEKYANERNTQLIIVDFIIPILIKFIFRLTFFEFIIFFVFHFVFILLMAIYSIVLNDQLYKMIIEMANKLRIKINGEM